MSFLNLRFLRTVAFVLLIGSLAAASEAAAMDQPDTANPQQRQTAAQKPRQTPIVDATEAAATRKPVPHTQRGGRDG